MKEHSHTPDCPSVARAALIVWACTFAVYWTTFLCSPRLFLFPEPPGTPGDIPEYAAALRGRPNAADMRKHPLYLPISRPLYRAANAARRRCGVNFDTCALALPGAVFGATAAAAGYLLLKRLRAPAAFAAAFFCSFTYAPWLMGSVTETYALTACAVNLFLLSVAGANDRWGPGRWIAPGALVAVSALCDMRSILLVAIPWYMLIRMRAAGVGRRVAAACTVTAAVVGGTAACTLWLLRVAGPGAAGPAHLFAWMKEYGGHYLVHRGGADFVRTILLESLSPLRPEGISNAGFAARLVHLPCAPVFLTCALFLAASSLGPIARRWRASPFLQGIAVWLGLSIAVNTLFIPGVQIHFAAPLVLPMLLLLLPGIADRWGDRPWGRRLLALAAAAGLLNNLAVLNERRKEWESAPLVREATDGLYLLPGEAARLSFLAQKGAARLPPAARAELRGKRGGLDFAFSALPEGERGEARDIARRGRALHALSGEAQR